jgi:hypothetical protein
MIRITLDKIASAAKNAGIETEATITHDIVAKEGYVIAARILTDKAVYNNLENAHGRMMRLKPGDQIAGVLGTRRGLYGYSGDVPGAIEVGDVINVLNQGGVLGRCTSYAPDVGEPFEAEVMGALLHFPVLGERIGEPAHIGLNTIPMTTDIKESAPVIAIVGTSMDAGKTVAACQIIHGLTKQGLTVAAAKVTGVALQRDILGMRDYGAVRVLSFNDAGLASTSNTTAPDAAKRIIAHLNRDRIDAIVLEFGDGILGEYGVQALLADPEITRHLSLVILCAADPVGVFGAKTILKEQYGLNIAVVTGPATDNDVGCAYIESVLRIKAANAIRTPRKLSDLVFKEVFDT